MTPPPRPHVHPILKLWRGVDVDDLSGCWEWKGATNGRGYGQMSVRGRKVYTHRFSYEIVNGPIPQRHDIDHLCRNPICANPDHLEAVTHAENIRRGNLGIRSLVCHKGHPKPGGKGCKECDRERNRAKRERYREMVRDNDPRVPHGKPSTFTNWSCRCDLCVAAWKAFRGEAA